MTTLKALIASQMKYLVVSDDQKLEVLLSRARFDYSTHIYIIYFNSLNRQFNQMKDESVRILLDESAGQTLDVFPVEIGGRLVQGQNARVETERFGKRQSNDDAGEHFLTSRATTAHVQLRFALDQTHTIVVRSTCGGRRRLGVRAIGRRVLFTTNLNLCLNSNNI